MDRAKLVDRWIELDTLMREFKREKDAITTEIGGEPGDVIEGSMGKKVRRRDRSNLDPAKLKAAVSTSMWTAITERKPVADLYKYMIRKGKLSQETIDGCSTRTESWLERL
jgi:hypothetical protein